MNPLLHEKSPRSLLSTILGDWYFKRTDLIVEEESRSEFLQF